MSRLEIEATNTGIIFDVHDGDNIIIDFTPPLHDFAHPTVELIDGLIRISHLPEPVRINNSMTMTGGGTLTVRVPTDFVFEDVNIITTNGGITMRYIALMEAEVRTSNGALIFENVEVSDSLTAFTSNGGLRLTNVCGGEIYVHTSNGGVSLRNVDARRNLTARTSNAAVDASNLEVVGSLDLHTSNANFVLRDSYVGGILTARTSNANITITNVETNFDRANISTSSRNNIVIN